MIHIELQVIGASLRAIAEEMGAALIRSAFSANIKERRDCSTALFDERGRMITQAEHIPVHLGAMPEAVAAVMAHDPRPASLGSSTTRTRAARTFPDITIVTRTELGFAVTRAHHADVGGSEPGSLPPARGRSTRRASSSRRRCSTTRPSSRSSPTCATRTSAAETCARSSPRTGSPSARIGALRAARTRPRRRGDGRAPRVLRARRARRNPRAAGRPLRGRRPSRDATQGQLDIRAL